jgi:hypothetical protein
VLSVLVGLLGVLVGLLFWHREERFAVGQSEIKICLAFLGK